MAKRRTKERRDVHLDYFFDRLLTTKLRQAYELLVPEHARQVGDGALAENDEDRRDLRQGLLGSAERGQHDSEPDGSVICPEATSFDAARRVIAFE